MRRLNLALLASLQLCAAWQPSFSIHDDLLAHPRFEVVFADDFISEHDALALLESSRNQPSADTPDASSKTDLTSKVRESAAADAGTGTGGPVDDEHAPTSQTYELINSAPWRYLCSIPVIAPPPALNQTATELAKAEEARELSRASARGWELMGGLDGRCLYFMSGWWSYTFCYGKGVVQFHALPSTKAGPPVRDENSQEYVLGRVDKSWDPRDDGGAEQPGGATKSVAPPNAQLQVKGNQRYLMQRLEGGTVCDLTGRPRTVEVQYHCQPGASGDRIGWVKEVTTCTYLMLVQTPRLCADVAFLPPKETRAHPIRCHHVIGTAEEESAWRYHRRVEAGELFGSNNKAKEAADGSQFAGMTIGGVLVGGRKVLGGPAKDGKPAHRLPPIRQVGAAVVEILARKKKDGATVEALSDAELEKLNLDPGAIAKLRQELQRRAGDRGWKLEAIEIPGAGYEFVGALDGDDDDEDKGEVGATQGKQTMSHGRKLDQKQGREKTGGEGAAAKHEGDKQEGSEEILFKEEL